MYKIYVAPTVNEALLDFSIRCTLDNGVECADQMVDCFQKSVSLLQEFPQRGVQRLRYIPNQYRVITFWPHKCLVYQIDEISKDVFIDYMIDDRSNYGKLLK